MFLRRLSTCLDLGSTNRLKIIFFRFSYLLFSGDCRRTSVRLRSVPASGYLSTIKYLVSSLRIFPAENSASLRRNDISGASAINAGNCCLRTALMSPFPMGLVIEVNASVSWTDALTGKLFSPRDGLNGGDECSSIMIRMRSDFQVPRR